ncbi:MAG: hypothetical protein ACFFCS_21435 [Candidatus Hodarchaeota archaeon]
MEKNIALKIALRIQKICPVCKKNICADAQTCPYCLAAQRTGHGDRGDDERSVPASQGEISPDKEFTKPSNKSKIRDKIKRWFKNRGKRNSSVKFSFKPIDCTVLITLTVIFIIFTWYEFANQPPDLFILFLLIIVLIIALSLAFTEKKRKGKW